MTLCAILNPPFRPSHTLCTTVGKICQSPFTIVPLDSIDPAPGRSFRFHLSAFARQSLGKHRQPRQKKVAWKASRTRRLNATDYGPLADWSTINHQLDARLGVIACPENLCVLCISALVRCSQQKKADHCWSAFETNLTPAQ